MNHSSYEISEINIISYVNSKTGKPLRMQEQLNNYINYLYSTDLESSEIKYIKENATSFEVEFEENYGDSYNAVRLLNEGAEDLCALDIYMNRDYVDVQSVQEDVLKCSCDANSKWAKQLLEDRYKLNIPNGTITSKAQPNGFSIEILNRIITDSDLENKALTPEQYNLLVLLRALNLVEDLDALDNNSKEQIKKFGISATRNKIDTTEGYNYFMYRVFNSLNEVILCCKIMCDGTNLELRTLDGKQLQRNLNKDKAQSLDVF